VRLCIVANFVLSLQYFVYSAQCFCSPVTNGGSFVAGSINISLLSLPVIDGDTSGERRARHGEPSGVKQVSWMDDRRVCRASRMQKIVLANRVMRYPQGRDQGQPRPPRPSPLLGYVPCEQTCKTRCEQSHCPRP
jgi:hypothetical protein